MNAPQQKTTIDWFAHFGGARDRAYIIENLSLLVSSGMTIIEALDGIATEVRSRAWRRAVASIRTDVEGGQPLWRALESTGRFPRYTISLIRIGEESGRLAENLRVVSEQENKERIFHSRIRSAMMYPVFVLTLTLVIGIGISWFILPKLAVVFSQLHVKLPIITKWLIAFGGFLGAYGSYVVPLVIATIAIIIYILFFDERTKFIGTAILFAIPGVGALIRETELSRFGYVLGTLLQAGLPVTEALTSLKEAAPFPPYRKLYAHLEKKIEEGNSFQKSFETYAGIGRYMPAPVRQLIVSGERSGALSQVLVKIGQSYEEKSEMITKDLAVILEPVLLVIVWLGVVAVALSVILPIYSLIGGLEQ